MKRLFKLMRAVPIWCGLLVATSATAGEVPAVITIGIDGTRTYELSHVQKITFNVSGSNYDGMELQTQNGAKRGAISCVKFGTTEEGSTAVASLSAQEVYVFPNPVSSYMTISGIDDDAVSNIYNQQGVLVQTVKGTTVDVLSLQTGTYYLQIEQQIIKFIKL